MGTPDCLNLRRGHVRSCEHTSQRTLQLHRRMGRSVKGLASSELVFCHVRPQFPLTRADIIKSHRRSSFDEEYELRKQVGSGSFGIIYLCQHRVTKQERACKIVPKSSLKDVELFLNEINVCMQLDHPNIIRLIEFYEEEDQVRLIFRYCDGMDLLDKIVDVVTNRGHFTPTEVAWAMRHMIKAVIGCHSHNIVHRDIKPENFVITEGEKEKKFGLTHAGLRLIDMGLSESLDQTGRKRGRDAGTTFYMAPEVLEGKYDHRCDTWSLGVIFYLMLTGDTLFQTSTSPEVEKRVEREILTPNYVPNKLKKITKVSHPYIPVDAKNLLAKMLAFRPEDRIPLEEAMQHQFFSRFTGETAHKQRIRHGLLESLQTFCKYPALKRTALLIVAHLTSDKYTKIQRRTFRIMDSSYNGELSVDEVVNYLRETTGAEVPPNFETEIFDIVANGAREISLLAFLAATLPLECRTSEGLIQLAFQVLDTNRDGLITWQDLDTLVDGRISHSVLKSVMSELSLRGRVDFNYFKKLMLA